MISERSLCTTIVLLHHCQTSCLYLLDVVSRNTPHNAVLLDVCPTIPSVHVDKNKSLPFHHRVLYIALCIVFIECLNIFELLRTTLRCYSWPLLLAPRQLGRKIRSRGR